MLQLMRYLLFSEYYPHKVNEYLPLHDALTQPCTSCNNCFWCIYHCFKVIKMVFKNFCKYEMLSHPTLPSTGLTYPIHLNDSIPYIHIVSSSYLRESLITFLNFFFPLNTLYFSTLLFLKIKPLIVFKITYI